MDLAHAGLQRVPSLTKSTRLRAPNYQRSTEGLEATIALATACWDRGLSDFPPVIDKLSADLRGETLRPDADRDAFARGREIVSAVLQGDGRAVAGHRWRLVGDPWLIEIVSCRVYDPLAVLLRAERVAADRRLRRDRSIAILDEQV